MFRSHGVFASPERFATAHESFGPAGPSIGRRIGMTTGPSTCSATLARNALERVCSGGPDSASRYYSPRLVDHVNDLEFQGLAGVRISVDLYQRMLSDL